MPPQHDAMADPPIDAELLKRSAASPAEFERAWDQVALRYLPAFTRYLARRTRDSDRAADLALEVLGQLFSRIDTYDPARGAFETWAWAACRNRCKDWQKREERRASRGEEVEADRVAPPNGDPESEALRRLWTEAVLRQLPPGQARVMQLRVEGYSHAEISATLGITEAASRKALQRARETVSANASSGPPSSKPLETGDEA